MIALNEATGIYPSLLDRAFELVGTQADAQDLVQTAYLRMLEKPPATTDPVKFKHWMCVVMKNIAWDRRRVEGKLVPIEDLDQCQVCGSYDARCGCCG